MFISSLSSKAAAKPPEVEVIGPFLGWRGVGAISVCVGLPHRTDSILRCELRDASTQLVVSAETGPVDFGPGASALFRSFAFDFSGLPPGVRLFYRFIVSSGEPVSLQGGLLSEDCLFVVPSADSVDASIALMSCHNPFMPRKGAADEGWAMWRQLDQTLKSDARIGLLVLGGDQVYNDDLEEEGFIAKLAKAPDDVALHDTVRRRLIRQYQLFWGDDAYRKVLARVPSVAMWDDHDITDGWGGRPEAWTGTDWDPGWRKYFELCREAFEAYQNIRNPPAPARFAQHPRKVFTNAFDFAGTRFLLLDLRSEKNLALKRVMSPELSEAVRAEIRETPASCRRLFVLSPVVPLRTNFEEDRRLSAVTKGWLEFQRILAQNRVAQDTVRTLARFGWVLPLGGAVLKPDGTLWGNLSALVLATFSGVAWLLMAALHWADHFTLLPQLTDDLEDGLSTDANRPELQRLLESLVALRRKKGVETVMLSGDIHAAGITEIVHRQGDELTNVPQVVASPIAYEPMPKMVEGFTTTTSEMDFWKSEDSAMWARNIFYVSKRNYAVIRVIRGATERPVEFHFEGHRLPMAFNLDFRGLDIQVAELM